MPSSQARWTGLSLAYCCLRLQLAVGVFGIHRVNQLYQVDWAELSPGDCFYIEAPGGCDPRGFFGPVILVKMALRKRGAHEKESTH